MGDDPETNEVDMDLFYIEEYMIPFYIAYVLIVIFTAWYVSFNQYTDKDILERYIDWYSSKGTICKKIGTFSSYCIAALVLAAAIPAYIIKVIIDSWKQGISSGIVGTIGGGIMLLIVFYLMTHLTPED